MSNSNKIKGISRRDFLKGTAAGALGVAAAGLLGGCASTPEKQECPPCEPTPSASSAGWPAVEALEPKVPMEGVVAPNPGMPQPGSPTAPWHHRCSI